VSAPVTSGLSHLIAGDVPLDEWVSLVRTTVPPPARFPRVKQGAWGRLRSRLTAWWRRDR
jgi:glycerol-3-phosphate dehydrogenase (NAD(P)+)